jgi:hypothetical protein
MPDRSRFKTAPPALPNWSRRFADPIPIPNGKSLFSLRDAAQYVLALPPAEQQATRWQTAATVLKMVAETGGNAMMARIGMMKALHHRAPGAAQTPRRKRVKSFSDHRLNRKNPGLLRTGVSFERLKVSGFYLITARLTDAGYYVASAPPSYASPAQAGSPREASAPIIPRLGEGRPDHAPRGTARDHGPPPVSLAGIGWPQSTLPLLKSSPYLRYDARPHPARWSVDVRQDRDCRLIARRKLRADRFGNISRRVPKTFRGLRYANIPVSRVDPGNPTTLISRAPLCS